MIRSGVKEKSGYMMLIFLVMFFLVQSYSGDSTEPDIVEDIVVSLTRSEQEKIDQIIHHTQVDDNVIVTEIELPDENELVKNLDQKIEDEIELSEFISEERKSNSLASNVRTTRYTDSLEIIRKAELSEPQDVTSSHDFIDIGMIIINLKKTPTLDSQFSWKMTRTFASMMTYSSGTPLHFIIITDKDSNVAVGNFFSHFISKRISEGAILQLSWRKKKMKGLPIIRVSFVDLKNIKKIDEPFIQALKSNTQEKDPETIDKYASDLFYIGPLYHRAFAKLDKMIFIDATDLHFYDDIKLLNELFKNIKDQIMGVGLDLSPHYRKFLADYLIINPGSSLGLPGKQQGFNTGVVLYRLDNMRKSKLYNSYITPERVTKLTQLYLYNMTLGDQDWFTNLGFSHPDLFYILPCQFNAQTSIQYLQPPWESVFDQYHNCDQKKNVKIYHRNGCGPMPEQCGYTPPPDSEYWQGKSHLTDMYMDIEALWEIMRDVHLGKVKFSLFQETDS